jgi:hypothetical protein
VQLSFLVFIVTVPAGNCQNGSARAVIAFGGASISQTNGKYYLVVVPDSQECILLRETEQYAWATTDTSSEHDQFESQRGGRYLSSFRTSLQIELDFGLPTAFTWCP